MGKIGQAKPKMPRQNRISLLHLNADDLSEVDHPESKSCFPTHSLAEYYAAHCFRAGECRHFRSARQLSSKNIGLG